MSSRVNLESLLKNNASINCVEIYLCSDKSVVDEAGIISIVANHQPITAFGAGHETTLTNYYYKDMCYTYDMTNDGQRVTKRTLFYDAKLNNGIFVVCLNEDTLPSHRFPCVRDISHMNVITRTAYRVNNRMYIHHDIINDEGITTDCFYLKYNHAPQVDLKQMQNDTDRALNVLLKKQ
jgi:hypothetical protein